MGRPLGHPVNAVSTGKGPENQGCDEKKLLLADLSPGTEVLPATCARVKVRRIPYSSELRRGASSAQSVARGNLGQAEEPVVQGVAPHDIEAERLGLRDLGSPEDEQDVVRTD